ncbi:MAG: hypothetical protein J1G06_04930 [Oscillospiraceae bacterium]|nr:hypothetical protein [Oscillospiraceae bacterium]
MNILKTKVKIITLLLSTVILLTSCSQGTENTVNASKITPSPVISTQAPAATVREKNKREFTGTRDEVISQKYVPCKHCSP